MAKVLQEKRWGTGNDENGKWEDETWEWEHGIRIEVQGDGSRHQLIGQCHQT